MIATAESQQGTARDLVRMSSFCLAVLFLLQTLAATLSMVAGPPHRHSEATFSRLGAAHAAAHAGHHAHTHDAHDHGVMTAEQLLAADVASLQLLSLLLALPPAHTVRTRVISHRLPETLAQAYSSYAAPPPRRPPRA